jgi:uncharacterized cupredoxin-like copper-binding protein
MNTDMKEVAVLARKNVTRIATAAVASALVLLMAACGQKATAQTPAPKAAASQVPQSAAPTGAPVGVLLGEKDISHMYMTVDTTQVAAGPVTFTVANEGVKKHEFVVLRTDTPSSKFRIVSFEGEKDRIDEDADGTNVGETGDMEAGTTQTLTIDLKPGHYALVCNLAGHYRMGMFTDFQVI